MKIKEKELKLLWLLAGLSDGAMKNMLELQYGKSAILKVDSRSQHMFTTLDEYYKSEYPKEYADHIAWAQELEDNFRHDGWNEFSSRIPATTNMRDEIKEILSILKSVEQED